MFLVLTRNFPPEVGGMQNLMWGLTTSLSKLDMVKVFADYHENSNIFDEKVSFSIERVKGPKIIRKFRKSFLINDFLTKNKKVRCIIADHWKSLENIKTEVKKICLIHSKEINHKKGSWLNKRVLSILNNVDYVIANSNFTKNMALRNLKEIYPDIIYVCIGYGDEEENIKKLVDQLGLSKQVIFMKNISNDLKNALVSSSNIFVMPSIIDKKSVEGFGIAFVEAAQFGVPSLGGKDGGASDAIIHEKTGLICDGNSLDEIYSSIDKLLKDRKYKDFGKLAKENSKKFHWDNIIEDYKRIL